SHKDNVAVSTHKGLDGISPVLVGEVHDVAEDVSRDTVVLERLDETARMAFVATAARVNCGNLCVDLGQLAICFVLLDEELVLLSLYYAERSRQSGDDIAKCRVGLIDCGRKVITRRIARSAYHVVQCDEGCHQIRLNLQG